MSDAPDQGTDRLPQLIGDAIVVWSQIEATWALIFFHLAYDGLGEPVGINPETGEAEVQRDPYRSAKQERAAAIFFSVPNSRSQRRMVVDLAAVALKSSKPDLFVTLKRLAKRTDKLSDWRNKFAHAYYDRPITIEGTIVTWGPVAVATFSKHQFSEHEIQQQITEFKKLSDAMNSLLMAVWDVADPPQL